MKSKNLIFIMGILLLVTGCADNVQIDQCLPYDLYGFWSGLWHGLTVIFSFIGSLFSDDILIYAINNTGGWYDFGYLIGLCGSVSLFVITIELLFGLLIAIFN